MVKVRSHIFARRDARGAFTLIELLVVITVITLLLALLLPALSNAKESGRRVICAQHLRQVSLAMLFVANENKGWINGVNARYTPTGDTWVSPPYYWMDAAKAQLGGSDALVKPAARSGCPSRDPRDIFYPYGVNTVFAGNGYGPMHSLNEVIHTDRIFLAADCYTWFPYSLTHLDVTIIGAPATGYYPRHLQAGLNFTFVDGHTEFLKAFAWNNLARFPYPVLWPPHSTSLGHGIFAE